MTEALTFHLPPDAGPDAVLPIFDVLRDAGDAPLAPAALRARVSERLGRQPRSEALKLVRDLTLVEQRPDGLAVTPRGRAVIESAEAADLVHGLSYFAWSPASPLRLSRMWTYRTVVDLLWEPAPVAVEPALKKRLAEELLGRAAAVFGGLDEFSAARASVGPKSIDGALRWLERLSPAVAVERRIQRRQRCAPALMALAVGALILGAGAEPGTDFRLGPEERGLLCRACFLEPAALDPMLEWTVQAQPHRIRWGTLNARYGRQLLLVDPGPLLAVAGHEAAPEVPV